MYGIHYIHAFTYRYTEIHNRYPNSFKKCIHKYINIHNLHTYKDSLKASVPQNNNIYTYTQYASIRTQNCIRNACITYRHALHALHMCIHTCIHVYIRFIRKKASVDKPLQEYMSMHTLLHPNTHRHTHTRTRAIHAS